MVAGLAVTAVALAILLGAAGFESWRVGRTVERVDRELAENEAEPEEESE